MIAAAAAHGHAEQAVQAHATTPALEHAWQAVQEGARVVLERVLAHAHQAVQGAAQEHALPVAAMPAVAVPAGHIK